MRLFIGIVILLALAWLFLNL